MWAHDVYETVHKYTQLGGNISVEMNSFHGLNVADTTIIADILRESNEDGLE